MPRASPRTATQLRAEAFRLAFFAALFWPRVATVLPMRSPRRRHVAPAAIAVPQMNVWVLPLRRTVRDEHDGPWEFLRIRSAAVARYAHPRLAVLADDDRAAPVTAHDCSRNAWRTTDSACVSHVFTIPSATRDAHAADAAFDRALCETHGCVAHAANSRSLHVRRPCGPQARSWGSRVARQPTVVRVAAATSSAHAFAAFVIAGVGSV